MSDEGLIKLKDQTDRIDTRISRMQNLIKSFTENGSKINDLIVVLAPFLSVEYRAEFASAMDNYQQDLGELAEILTLLGQDITDLGYIFIDDFRELQKAIRELK